MNWKAIAVWLVVWELCMSLARCFPWVSLKFYFSSSWDRQVAVAIFGVFIGLRALRIEWLNKERDRQRQENWEAACSE